MDRDREYLLNKLYDDEAMRPGLLKYIFADGDNSPPYSYSEWKSKMEDQGVSDQTKIAMNVNSEYGVSIASNKLEFAIKKKKTSPLLVNQLANFMAKGEDYNKKETTGNMEESLPDDPMKKKEAENQEMIIKNKGKNKEKNKKVRIREGKKRT